MLFSSRVSFHKFTWDLFKYQYCYYTEKTLTLLAKQIQPESDIILSFKKIYNLDTVFNLFLHTMNDIRQI